MQLLYFHYTKSLFKELVDGRLGINSHIRVDYSQVENRLILKSLFIKLDFFRYFSLLDDTLVKELRNNQICDLKQSVITRIFL